MWVAFFAVALIPFNGQPRFYSAISAKIGQQKICLSPLGVKH